MKLPALLAIVLLAGCATRPPEPLRDAAGYTASDYRHAAASFDQEGKTKLARAARSRAEMIEHQETLAEMRAIQRQQQNANLVLALQGASNSFNQIQANSLYQQRTQVLSRPVQVQHSGYLNVYGY